MPAKHEACREYQEKLAPLLDDPGCRAREKETQATWQQRLCRWDLIHRVLCAPEGHTHLSQDHRWPSGGLTGHRAFIGLLFIQLTFAVEDSEALSVSEQLHRTRWFTQDFPSTHATVPRRFWPE